MSTTEAHRCSWRILKNSWFSSGLPQGSLFTQIIYNSLFRLCPLSGIMHTSPELWNWRVHESVLVAILLGRSWLSDDIISVPKPLGRYDFWRSSLEDVLVVDDQNRTCFGGTSGWFCWLHIGCNEVNRLFVSGIYHNYTGRGRTPLVAMAKFCAASIIKIPKYRHCFHRCSGYY